MTVLWFFYFIAMSLIAYILYAADKRRAQQGAMAHSRANASAFRLSGRRTGRTGCDEAVPA